MSQPLHSSFKLNGLFYNEETLLKLADDLINHGHQHEKLIGEFLKQWFNDSPFLTVRTSGSTGTPKNIKIAKNAMINSAVATGDYFNLSSGTSALLCLSAGYIAGKMMLVRAMTLGWHLHIVAPEKDALTQYDNSYDFVAMVPYQVHHSLRALQKVKKIIIGGGEINPKLEDKLQSLSTQVFATYGMTETVTHIAARSVNGTNKSNYYSALPNVYFEKDERGCLVIDAPTVSEERVVTNDLVNLISKTHFEWLGRYDNVINSGGIKVFPEQVEKKLSNFILEPFIIASEKDVILGNKVILIIETDSPINKETIKKAFSVLENYQRPKKIYTFSKFPITETGKIKRSEILKMFNERSNTN